MKTGDPVKLYNPQSLQKLLTSQEAQAYAMAFLSFFALAFFTIFAIRPALISFFNLRQQIADAEALNVKLDEKINTLLAAQQVYQAYQNDILTLEKALPPDPQLAQLIQKLESIINEKNATATAFTTNNQVTLLEISPLVAEQPSAPGVEDPAMVTVAETMPVESVSFSLDIFSDYVNDESVLVTLLNLKRIIALKELQMTASMENESDVLTGVGASLTAEAYYLPAETP